MFPYNFGANPYQPSGGMFYPFRNDVFGERGYPEEIRQAIEDNREQIHSEEDMRNMIDYYWKKR